jgi:hypothetical protein
LIQQQLLFTSQSVAQHQQMMRLLQQQMLQQLQQLNK